MTYQAADLRNIKSKTLELTIVPGIGGGIASLKALNANNEWVDIFRPANQKTLNENDPQGLGCFTSMPYVSRIKNGQFDFNNKTYTIPPNQPPGIHPLHGIVWRRKPDIKNTNENTIRITHNIDEPDYPFTFESMHTWTLKDKSLEINLSITNKGEEPLPFGMGLHPFFNKTPKSRIRAKLGKIIINDENICPVALEDIPPEHDTTTDFKTVTNLPLDNCFTGWDQTYDIEWPDLNTKLSCIADGIFKYLVICAPKDENWFCVNPVTHFNDAYNNSINIKNHGLTTLNQNQTMRGKLHFNIESL